MLHSDTLAQEFNEILNGVEIFAPFQPLDPAVTFYAPLRNTVRDLRLSQDDFQRASDAWYKDGSGIYRNVGINRARFEESRILMEPAGTNKCENFNFAPDAALTGLTRAGSNPDAVVSRVITDMPPELAVMNNGYAIELDNRTGTGSATISVSGSVNSLEFHTLSAWVRVLDAVPSNTQMRTNDGSISIQLDNTNWQRIDVSGTPGDINNFFQIFCGAADRVRVHMIGNQLEQSMVVSSPIVTEGTAGQRAIGNLNYAPTSAFIDVNEGAAAIDFQYLYPIGSYEAADRVGCLSPRTNNYNSIITHFGNQGGNYQVRTYNSSGNATVSHGEPVSGWARYVSTWSVSNNALRISALVDGAWIHGNQIAGNPILDLGQMNVGLLPTKPCRLGEAYILDRYLTTQEVEDMFS